MQNEFQVANQCEIEAELKFGIENSCRKVGNGLGSVILSFDNSFDVIYFITAGADTHFKCHMFYL